MLDADTGLLMTTAMKGQVVHRTQTRILETRATITPKGDFLLMFPEGEHYAKSKGEKINAMMACRSMLLFHGAGDATTPFKGAQLFTDAMRKAGNRIELVAPKDAIHTYMFKDADSYAETLKRMEAFFAEQGLLPQAN